MNDIFARQYLQLVDLRILSSILTFSYLTQLNVEVWPVYNNFFHLFYSCRMKTLDLTQLLSNRCDLERLDQTLDIVLKFMLGNIHFALVLWISIKFTLALPFTCPYNLYYTSNVHLLQCPSNIISFCVCSLSYSKTLFYGSYLF